jgi:hypothetical protein
MEMMISFIESDILIRGDDKFIPEKIFIKYFKDYCQSKQKYTESVYKRPFSDKKIDIKYHSGMYKGRMFNNQRFLFGVDVKEQEYGPTSDEFDV